MTMSDQYERVGGPISVGGALALASDSPPVEGKCVDCGGPATIPGWLADIVRAWNHKHHKRESPITRNEVVGCGCASRVPLQTTPFPTPHPSEVGG